MPGKAQTAKIGRKAQKAMNKSNNVAKTFKAKIKAGQNVGYFFLATVIQVNGGGRFVVEDLNKVQHVVKVAKIMFTKAAKHRDATMPTAVHVGSHVIVDADTIRSVVGANEARQLRHMLKANSARSKNSIFTRNSSSNNGSSSNGSSSKKRKSSKVGMKKLGGWRFW
jgi:hypothetical protein